MTRVGDCFVGLCLKLFDIPAATLCLLLFLVQAAVMDYYLITHLSADHYSWVAADALNLCLLVSCIYQSHVVKLQGTTTQPDHTMLSFAWLSWLIINLVLGAKTIVIFHKFAHTLEEENPTFFGPNTLKTTIALGSCVFLLLLTTQHDAPLGSDRRRYIDELTGTVVFDLLDTADILEILFEESKTDTFWGGLKEFILAVATMNLLIPTVPLLTLSKTKFGRARLQRRLIYLHRLLVVLAVNVPNLVVRLNLWHGYNVAISPFTLKNIILICITVYEFYLHKKGKYQARERERRENVASIEKTAGSNKMAGNDKVAGSVSDKNHVVDKINVEDNKSSAVNTDNLQVNFALEQRTVTYL